jgi:hypothetical protein
MDMGIPIRCSLSTNIIKGGKKSDSSYKRASTGNQEEAAERKCDGM